MTPVRVVGERLRGRSEVIDERLEFARELLRSQLTTLFEPELARQSGTARRDLLDAIEVATSWSTWNLLRTEQGCSVARARAVVTRTLTALLSTTPSPNVGSGQASMVRRSCARTISPSKWAAASSTHSCSVPGKGAGTGWVSTSVRTAAALGRLRRLLDARVVVEDVLQACGRDGAHRRRCG